MVGEAAGLIGDYPKVSADKAFLEIHKLSWANPDPFGCSLRDIDLAVCSGEIVGIAGVAGNGQDEWLALLSGETQLPRHKGETIRFDGQPVAHRSEEHTSELPSLMRSSYAVLCLKQNKQVN